MKRTLGITNIGRMEIGDVCKITGTVKCSGGVEACNCNFLITEKTPSHVYAKPIVYGCVTNSIAKCTTGRKVIGM
jgi:hypothetical protein